MAILYVHGLMSELVRGGHELNRVTALREGPPQDAGYPRFQLSESIEQPRLPLILTFSRKGRRDQNVAIYLA